MTTLPQYTSIGSYTILYVDSKSGECYCAECAKPEHDAGTFDEGEPIPCDECGTAIESSYG